METLKKIYGKLHEGTIITYTVISNSLRFITRTLNLVPNFQWKANLNLFQNLAYNLYIPDSSGKPGMHVSLLAIFMFLIVMTLCMEMVKFYFVQEYKFSEGFWILLGGLAAMVQVMFTRDSHIKMNKNSSVEKVEGEVKPDEEKQVESPETSSEGTIDAADLQVVASSKKKA